MCGWTESDGKSRGEFVDDWAIRFIWSGLGSEWTVFTLVGAACVERAGNMGIHGLWEELSPAAERTGIVLRNL